MNKYETFSKVVQTKRELMIWNGCQRKVRFASEADACFNGHRTYKCKICRGWHRSGSFGRLVAKVHKLNKHKVYA